MIYKQVTVLLKDDPQPYTLVRNFNKVCDVETELKINLLGGNLGADVNANQVRALLYAYLKTAHTPTIEEAGELLSRGTDSVPIYDALYSLIRDTEMITEVPNKAAEAPIAPTAPVAAPAEAAA